MTLPLSALLAAVRTFESRVIDAERRATEDAALAELTAALATAGVTLVDDRPDPLPSVYERAHVTEEVNGIWRGYTVEVHSRSEPPVYNVDTWALRFVHLEGEVDGPTSIVDIVEVDLSFVRAKLRPRVGLRVPSGYGAYEYAAAPVRAALDEVERRRTELLATIPS